MTQVQGNSVTNNEVLSNNLKALHLSSDLKANNQSPTNGEKKILADYSGWGSLAKVFENTPQYTKERDELKLLLGENRFNEIRRSILDSYYTPSNIAETLWKGLVKLGFKKGSIIDPCVGGGALIDATPIDLQKSMDWTCIEKCPATADLFSLRHPEAKLINKDYTDLALMDNQFQAAILNPPFVEGVVSDSYDKNLGMMSIHNLFVAKTLRKIRSGGVAAIVVSRYFMDSQDEKAREQAGLVGRLIGAWRLPSGAFATSGTDVITDILFFERTDDVNRLNSDDWLKSNGWQNENDPIHINEWFIKQPKNLLGIPDRGTNQYHRPDFKLNAFGDLNKDLESIVDSLPENIFTAFDDLDFDYDSSIVVEDEYNTKIFGFCFDTLGNPVQRVNDELDEKRYQRLAIQNSKIDRLQKLLKIRNTLSDLLKAETKDYELEEINHLRNLLNQNYDLFVTKYGAIHGIGNVFMRNDPDYALLLGLEIDFVAGISATVAIKEGIPPKKASWKKADIFSDRICFPYAPNINASNAQDALTLSLKEFGKVNFDYMMDVSGYDIDSLKTELEGKIYCPNPKNQQWVSSDEYLSGNVRKKLQAAIEDEKTYPSMVKNIKALEKVIPADISPSDIFISIGAPWLPGSVLKDFVHFVIEADIKEPIHAAGEWFLEIPSWVGNHAKQTSRYGTERKSFGDIFKSLINNKALTVYDYDSEGKRYVNTVDTTAIETKADDIKELWNDWLFKDSERRENLSRLYNDLFNNTVLRSYDGSFLVDENGLLPNQNPNIKLAPHQLNAIWRIIVTGNVLIDAAVGLGKTFISVASIMEMIRMGLTKKAMVTVPNHLVTSWRSEIARLYPSSKVLAANTESMSKANRRAFIATATLNHYDIIIIPHSSFTFIPAPDNYLVKFLSEQVEDIVQGIKLANESGNNYTVRQLEKRKQKYKNKIKNILSRPTKDLTLSFDQLGIEMLYLDESHLYKNLLFSTSLTNVAGLGNQEGSQRSLDLFCKARYLQDNNEGRGLISLTATPISNSLVEMWTVQRYHQYDDLKEVGMNYLDTWIATYAEPKTSYELSVSGEFKLKTRLSEFCNVPELLTKYRAIAEVVTKAELKELYVKNNLKWPEPTMTNGKPFMITAERSPDQTEYFLEILDRAKNMSNVLPTEDNWLKLTTDSTKASLDLRLIDTNHSDYPGSKVNMCVSEVYKVHQKWNEQKGTQIIFCDLGTPKPAKKLLDGEISFSYKHNVYQDIKDKLMLKGVPEKEIAFIHDFKTDRQKENLVRLMNKGIIRILLSSTLKGGTGLNIQQKIVSVHHLDSPWRPSDSTQRSGRALRRGNMFYDLDESFTVGIYWYATKLTLDTMRNQTLQFKARFIDQIKRGDYEERTLSDSDDSASSYGEMKALISGNPLLLKLFKTEQSIQKLERLEKAHKRSLWNAESYIKFNSDYELKKHESLVKHQSDMAKLDEYGTAPVYITENGNRYSGKTLKDGLMDDINNTFSKSNLQLQYGIEMGSINGFKFTLTKKYNNVDFFLEGQYFNASFSYAKDERISVNGLITRLKNALIGIPANQKYILDRFEKITSELAIMKEEVSRDFSKKSELKYQQQLLRAITQALAENKLDLPEEFSAESVLEIESTESSLLAFDEEVEPLTDEVIIPAPQKAAAPALNFLFATPGNMSIALAPC
jgi:N12 class adenine-specific DNA methylase